MRRAFQRCKETITRMVGSHGRADPSILDGVQVSLPNANPTEGPTKSRLQEGPSYNIREFATIGTRDGSLIVTCFDPSTVKHVERAIYTAELGLSPQRLTGEDEEGVLNIPIPRPTSETRAQLSKDISKICENARVSIRTARHLAQKQIRSDEKRKVIGADEARTEMKGIDEETKKQTAEVDKLYEQMKARIEQN
ncbi:ribosome recycling factor [Meira miltonrushii]|uniref:Ribosome recycling factor n=1 Tax=Meira miltonrushii TaxID=1280837 RepID=A0A316VED4_9BASI|nr:ribosome recycling factor [Meira miltonrushii]PWN33835.1 ribosome recycling factor [Meira miltonrushii]